MSMTNSLAHMVNISWTNKHTESIDDSDEKVIDYIDGNYEAFSTTKE